MEIWPRRARLKFPKGYRNNADALQPTECFSEFLQALIGLRSDGFQGERIFNGDAVAMVNFETQLTLCEIENTLDHFEKRANLAKTF